MVWSSSPKFLILFFFYLTKSPLPTLVTSLFLQTGIKIGWVICQAPCQATDFGIVEEKKTTIRFCDFFFPARVA